MEIGGADTWPGEVVERRDVAMAADDREPTLVRLEEAKVMLPNRDVDVRGRKVIDGAGQDVGKVRDLIVDTVGHQVRFLLIKVGGVLHVGGSEHLVPVDLVTAVDHNTVHLRTTRDEIAQTPAFDPDRAMNDPQYYTELYAAYDTKPFWTAGYVYPGYPFTGDPGDLSYIHKKTARNPVDPRMQREGFRKGI